MTTLKAAGKEITATSSPGRFYLAFSTSEAREKRPGDKVDTKVTFAFKFLLCFHFQN